MLSMSSNQTPTPASPEWRTGGLGGVLGVVVLQPDLSKEGEEVNVRCTCGNELLRKSIQQQSHSIVIPPFPSHEELDSCFFFLFVDPPRWNSHNRAKIRGFAMCSMGSQLKQHLFGCSGVELPGKQNSCAARRVAQLSGGLELSCWGHLCLHVMAFAKQQ